MAEGPWDDSVLAVVVSAVIAAVTQIAIWLRIRAKVRKEEESKEIEEESEVTLARMKLDDEQQERFINYLREQLAQARVDLHQVVLERDALQHRNTDLAANAARMGANIDILKAALAAAGVPLPRLVPIKQGEETDGSSA